MSSAKDAARQLIDRLPESATLNDIIYELYVKQKIDAGLKASRENRVTSHEQVKQRYATRSD